MSDYYSLLLPVGEMEQGDVSPSLVFHDSPLEIRERVERFAVYFKREMHFDLPQYEASETPDKPWFIPHEAFLFHKSADDLWDGESPAQQRFFGACCFRWREWTNAPAEWSLDWIWMHPFFRTCGHLQNAWPEFERRYGHFHIAHPLSAGMEKFLRKIGRDSAGGLAGSGI